MSLLRSDATWEERRAWAYEQAKARLAAWQWPAAESPAGDAEAVAEARALAVALRRGMYTGRPAQAASVQARLRELTGEDLVAVWRT